MGAYAGAVESDVHEALEGDPRRPRRVSRLGRRRRITEEQFDRRFSAQFAKHWAQVRSERRQGELDQRSPSIDPGRSNFTRAQVPYGVDVAAAWSWRFVVIVAAGYLIARALAFFTPLVVPLVVALFLAALVSPLVGLLGRRLPRGAASLLVVVATLGSVGGMLTLATQQVIDGATGLTGQVVDGLEQIRRWLRDGPLGFSETQIDNAINQLQSAVISGNRQLVTRATEVGAAVGYVIAGFFIVLFATYFFLADGRRIWAWVVRLFPRAARARADSSGRVAWLSLTRFVRATVLVALADAMGIMTVAVILNVPFVLAIGVLVFLGAFVPLVGATVSGVVAVLVALVSQGPLTAVLMLGGVILVQQLEAHVLQPFLMGRMVSVHPLGVILAIGAGVYLAGIIGALIAVPFVAAANAVAVYLASAPPEPEVSGDAIAPAEA